MFSCIRDTGQGAFWASLWCRGLGWPRIRPMEGPIADLIPNRRREKRTRHPAYRYLRGAVLGVGGLALLSLPVLGVLAAWYPHLSGAAYLALININLILLGVVVLFTLRRLLLMFLDRRGKLRNGRLHVRLLGVFSVLAVIPALLVALLAVYLLNLGIESWFSAKVNRALEGSRQVAEAYLDEHERTLSLEVQAIGQDPLLRERPWLLDLQGLRPWLRGEMQRRRLDDLAFVDDDGTVISQGSPIGGLVMTPEMLASLRAPLAQASVFRDLSDGRVAAAVPLRGNIWLVGQRYINPGVTARVDETTAAFQEYESLNAERAHLRWLATLYLMLMAAVTLAGAIWTGIRLANKIVRPVTGLVHATNRVSAGDLTVRLTPADDDELGVLTQAFNRMTQQLANQRDLVEKKNKELDERRKQMEAVLTGVTAAVFSVDATGLVRSANHTANQLLGLKVGGKLEKASPAIFEAWEAFVANPRPLAQQQVKLNATDGDQHTLLLRLVPQYVEGGKVGSVVATADDITPLIGAQRLAAWRDVARRLAHEIKNPLTPIKLSAERLQRKYLKLLPESDQTLFKELTDTIVQQAEDMRRMTNEFSDFARMPVAIFQQENLIDLVDQAVALQSARGGIRFEKKYEVKRDEAKLFGDRGQINRVLVNVIENAVNAIEEAPKAPPKETKKGKASAKSEKSDDGLVTLVVKKTHDARLRVTVLDNGKGLPPEVDVTKLFDPYVTTRKGGTGLGLAIVRKVMDEHEGQVRLLRRPEGGTAVELTFNPNPTAPRDKPELQGVGAHEPEPPTGQIRGIDR